MYTLLSWVEYMSVYSTLSIEWILTHSTQLNWMHQLYSTQLNWVERNAWVWVYPHWKKYFNVHFKSQNYSCLLDSHPCLGYRNFCCKKISCNKSKIKAVVLMEKLKQHNLGVKFTPAYFFPCHFDSENKLHWQYSLSIRQYSLSIRQRILLM